MLIVPVVDADEEPDIILTEPDGSFEVAILSVFPVRNNKLPLATALPPAVLMSIAPVRSSA
jgi:hypothetical protein